MRSLAFSSLPYVPDPNTSRPKKVVVVTKIHVTVSGIDKRTCCRGFEQIVLCSQSSVDRLSEI